MKRMKRWPALFLLLAAALILLAGCGKAEKKAVSYESLKSRGKMALEYANQFDVEYFEGDYAMITIGEDHFLLVPEGKEVPEGLDDSVKPIRQPLSTVYLAASSAMDYFRQLDALSMVTMTSTQKSDWSFPEVVEALDNEEMFYVGKYSAPDFEVIVDENCGLAIESTMIYHSPSIKEKLEQMGIPVLVERSSYEEHPLGRMEWIKLYGLLAGKEKEAEEFFNEQIDELNKTVVDDPTGKRVAYFYISSAGKVNVHKPGDYISKMIELAGGTYFLTPEEANAEDNALSTTNMDMESFYESAVDADILIYNSTIEGDLKNISQLMDKSERFKEFKAVKNGNVWCTEHNMFQQGTGLSRMITELYNVFHEKVDDPEKLEFLHPLK